MAAYRMLGRNSMDAIKAIIEKRTDMASCLNKQDGGVLGAGYTLLGEVDLVLIVDIPNTESAMKASATLSKLLGITLEQQQHKLQRITTNQLGIIFQLQKI